jgi:hypothetical protein
MNSSETAGQLLSQALDLPVADREALALDLLASLPADDENRAADDSLQHTIRDRLAERDSGTARTIDAATFAARVRAAAQTARQRGASNKSLAIGLLPFLPGNGSFRGTH